MKRVIKFSLNYILIAIIGTLFHFMYKWTGENVYLSSDVGKLNTTHLCQRR